MPLYSATALPFVNNRELVVKQNKLIKSIFWNIWKACFEEFTLSQLPKKYQTLWLQNQTPFELAFKAYRYGMIYFVSREELKEDLNNIQTFEPQINEIYSLLEDMQLFNYTFNLTVNRFVFEWPCKKACAQMIAPNQFQLSKEQVLYYRDDAFYRHTEQIHSLGDTTVYDLHDFAHLISTLCKPSLYGCYYHDLDISITDFNFRNVIAMPSERHTDKQLIADGFVYTNLTRFLYDKLNDKEFEAIDDIVDSIAESLCDYYLALSKLSSSDNSESYGLKNEIGTYDLLILSLNKLYEHSASLIAP